MKLCFVLAFLFVKLLCFFLAIFFDLVLRLGLFLNLRICLILRLSLGFITFLLVMEFVNLLVMFLCFIEKFVVLFFGLFVFINIEIFSFSLCLVYLLNLDRPASFSPCKYFTIFLFLTSFYSNFKFLLLNLIL
jgi:hypothetical protein